MDGARIILSIDVAIIKWEHGDKEPILWLDFPTFWAVVKTCQNNCRYGRGDDLAYPLLPWTRKKMILYVQRQIADLQNEFKEVLEKHGVITWEENELLLR